MTNLAGVLRAMLGVVREDAIGRLRSWRAWLVLCSFTAWAVVPSVYDATRRIAQRSLQPEANRQAWALIRSYDIDAARWLHDCPRALVTATIIDLNLAALVTLLVAYDCLVGQKSSTNLGDRRAPLRISPFVMGRWASVLSFWALATLFSHASIGLVQVLAHGDAARVFSWAAETWLVVVACAATWSALWTLLTVWIETPRRALSIGVMVTVALTVGRMALRTRFNYAVVPSMLDTGLLSGLPMRFARTLATGAIWSGASLVVATAALGKRRERRPSTW